MRQVIICSEEENAKVFKKRKTLNAAFSEPKMAFPGCVVTPSTVFLSCQTPPGGLIPAWKVAAAIKAPTTSKVFLALSGVHVLHLRLLNCCCGASWSSQVWVHRDCVYLAICRKIVTPNVQEVQEERLIVVHLKRYLWICL